jgi:chromosomal replication initiator protein
LDGWGFGSRAPEKSFISEKFMTSHQELWDGVLRRLGSDLPAFALEAWLRPLAAEVEGEGLRLLCPTAFHMERVRERYLPRIAALLAEQAGRALLVSLAVARAGAERPGPAPRERATAPAPCAAAPQPAPAPPAQRTLPYTFDSFVVGPCNALAREASLALAQSRQQSLNPLFLVSEQGLGKTHLARAIVAEARRCGSEGAVYTSAEGFTSEFMTAIRSKRMEPFKQRFRRGCQLLVIEDVQFLGSKTATQLELFHTLVHLLDAGVRVVLSADRLPRRSDGFEPRLCSQMVAGLVAELEPPDAAVRRRILRAKASAGGVGVPDDCLDRLVEGARGSVRDLEGVLIQLVAMASLMKRPIDLELTEAALRKLAAPEPRGRLDATLVIRTVALFFGMAPEALAARSRRKDVLIPRQLAMYLCRRYTGLPLVEIARAFDRDHPAVSNAVKVVERRILERAPLRYQVEELSARLDRLERSRPIS